jgi:hypothetical protein
VSQSLRSDFFKLYARAGRPRSAVAMSVDLLFGMSEDVKS